MVLVTNNHAIIVYITDIIMVSKLTIVMIGDWLFWERKKKWRIENFICDCFYAEYTHSTRSAIVLLFDCFVVTRNALDKTVYQSLLITKQLFWWMLAFVWVLKFNASVNYPTVGYLFALACMHVFAVYVALLRICV